MSVALRGNLKDFGIADVFQLIGQQRKTGVLEFNHKSQCVQLRFDSGAVVGAAPAGATPHDALGEMLARCGMLTRERVDDLLRECATSGQNLARLIESRGWLERPEIDEIENLLTRETIFHLLRWTEGSFDFKAQAIEHERAPETLLGAEQILMDGLRMLDEWRSFADGAPAEDQIYQQAGDFDAYRSESESLGPVRLDRTRRIFDMVDGQLNIRNLIDRSRLGTFDAMRILIDLRDRAVITPVDKATARRQRKTRRRTAGSSGLRALVASVVALAALVLVTGAIHRRAPPTRPEGVIAISRDPLASVAVANGVRRVRHALDAYRFARGSRPNRLSMLGDSGLLAETALTSPEGRPYYYRKRHDGAVLLAPER